MRTDVSYALPDGCKALMFDRQAFIVFDLYLLQRPQAEKDYSENEVCLAREQFLRMSEMEKETLFSNALLGLPGSNERFTPEQILAALKTYESIDAVTLKRHLFYFLQQIVPVAEGLGVKMAIHPDDPPFSILGLPRVVSTERDIAELLHAVPSTVNGICFCTGSLGVRADNDLKGMIKRFGDNIHFLHLRNIKREGSGNFFESGHIEGDVDMYDIIKELVILMQRRKVSLPMRPDHGHQMLDDLKKTSYPGYSAIGRLKGLAELRGLERAISGNMQYC
jgi:mannonate dehydratase